MPDPELTPAEEERVRRLLADARATGPMPADVVARLDAVLADLAAAPSAPASDAAAVAATADRSPVVDLATRRRRRRLTTVLVAAAAVTVVGVGVPGLLQRAQVDSADDGAAISAESAAENEEAPATGDVDEGDRSAGGSGPDYSADTLARAPAVRPERFRRDALRLSEPSGENAAELDGRALLADCAGVEEWGDGELVPATYDGKLGALVYRTPEDGWQRVDLFLCGVTGVVRSIELPVP